MPAGGYTVGEGAAPDQRDGGAAARMKRAALALAAALAAALCAAAPHAQTIDPNGFPLPSLTGSEILNCQLEASPYITTCTTKQLGQYATGGVIITGTPQSGYVPIASSATAAAWGPQTGAGGLTIGTTAITGATNGNVLINNSGVLGQVANSISVNGTPCALGGSCSPAGGTGITALTGDVTATGPGSVAATLATVNSNVGSFGSTSAIPNFTVNAKGLITAAGSNSIAAPVSGLTGAGTGVVTALGNTVNAAGGIVLFSGALGTPTSGNGANLTGLVYTALPALSANQVLGALTATTPSGLAVPSCSGGSNALIWTSGSGFGCNTITGGVGTVSNSDGTLTISPTSGAVVASIALGHANTWSATQTFSSGVTISGGSFTATGLVTNADLATQTANTVLGNATSGAASPTALAVGSCSTAGSALNWTTNTGFGCNTSITAAAAPLSGITGLGTGVATALGNAVNAVGGLAPVTSPTLTNATVTGSFTATGLVTLADHAIQGANTIIGNAASITASPTALAIPSCSTATSALTWTSGGGFGCNSIASGGTITGIGTVNNIAVFTGTTAIGALSPASNSVLQIVGVGTPAFTAMPSCSAGNNGLIWTTGSGFGCNTFAGIGSQNPNTVVANATNSIATPTAVALPGCTGSSGALQYTPGTGFGCYTAFADSSSSNNNTITTNVTSNNVFIDINLANPNTWTGKQTFTGGLIATGQEPLTNLVIQGANTIVGNPTSISASPVAMAVPSCSSAANALIWTANIGFGCNTISGSGTVSSGTIGNIAVYTGSTTVGSTATGTGVVTALGNAVNAAGGLAPVTSPTLTGVTVTGSFTATGLVTNADLANSATTVNGTGCTLGSTCTVTAAAGTLTGGTLAAGVTASSLTSVGTLSALTVSGTTTLSGVAGASTYCVQINSSGVLSNTGSVCGAGGGAVSSVSDSGAGTLTISPTTGAVLAALNLNNANTWTAAQTFNANDLVLGGVTGGGVQCLQASNTGVVTGTGSACGGSGSTPGGFVGQLQFYGTGAVFSGASAITTNGTTTVTIPTQATLYAPDGGTWSNAGITEPSTAIFTGPDGGAWKKAGLTATALTLSGSGFTSSNAGCLQTNTSGVVAVASAGNPCVTISGSSNQVLYYNAGIAAGASTITTNGSTTVTISSGTTVTGPDSSTWSLASGLTGLTTLSSSVVKATTAGSVSGPSIVLSNCGTNCGIYSTGSGKLDITVAGAKAADYGDATAGTWTFVGTVASTASLQVAAGSTFYFNGRGILSSPTAGQIQLGNADATSPVTQTLRFQSQITTANTAPGNATIQGPLSTGIASSDLVFTTTNNSAGSTTQNTATAALTLKGGSHVPVFNASFTVAGLPTGVTGMRTFVTDQTTACPSTGAALTGGGAIFCPVYYNGSAWVGG